MSIQNELTYILGAGASYQSIPLVNTFPSRFEKFVNQLEPLDSIVIEEKKIFQNVKISAQKVLNEISSHQSFDTYFKKLFHTDKTDEIENGKKILNIYFTWEHNQEDIEDENHIDNGKFYKRAAIDKRYDALIASLLVPVKGVKKTYTKTNFITWNYDLNLFSSLKNYFSPDSTIKDFLNDITTTEHKNIWNINNEIVVINLNGFFYSTLFNNSTRIGKTISLELLKNAIRSNFLGKIENTYNSIQFGWETDFNDYVIIKAQEKIQKSKNIVSIGYTFPLYNRLIDLIYFNKKNLADKLVYIQDPKSDMIVDFVNESFGITTSTRKTKPIKDCSSFFVPFDIFDSELDTEESYHFANQD